MQTTWTPSPETAAELDARMAALEAELEAAYAARNRTPDLAWVPVAGPESLES